MLEKFGDLEGGDNFVIVADLNSATWPGGLEVVPVFGKMDQALCLDSDEIRNAVGPGTHPVFIGDIVEVLKVSL